MNKLQALTAVRDDLQAGTWPGSRMYDVLTDAHAALAFDAYNGSLDAAIALHEAVLPGWRWLVERNGNASIYPPDENLTKAIDVDGADNPARAWLLAILEALIAQDGQG